MKLFLLTITALLTTVWSSWAISFDIWETGLSRQQIVSLARQHDVPLAKDRLRSNVKSFDPQLVAGETDSFYYYTSLLDHFALVHMRLSPQRGNYGQFLYEIDIQFSSARDLRPYLVKLLDDKYGPGSMKFDMARKILVWHPEKDGEVTLITTPALLQLIYTDTKIKTFAEKLSKSTYGLPNKPLSHKDDLSTLFRTHDYAAFFMASKTSGASFPLAE
jgi:hypothetical protein